MITLAKLALKRRAKWPLIHVLTLGEERALLHMKSLWRDVEIWEWSCTEGLYCDQKEGKSIPRDRIAETQDPGAMLPMVRKKLDEEGESKKIFILKDVHPFLESPVIRRHFRDIANDVPHSASTVLLLGPEFKIPPDLEKSISIYEFPFPDEEELYHLALAIQEKNKHIVKTAGKEHLQMVAKACCGLSFDEAENILSESISELRRMDFTKISEEKRDIFKKAGLEVRIPTTSLDDLGGMEDLKDYLGRVKKVLSSPAAAAFGVAPLKGLGLIGGPGTGKSATVDGIAQLLARPLVTLAPDSLMGSLVGESESKTRNALSRISSFGPCVLRIDEAEKCFAGSMGPATDSGAKQGVINIILTWMQEHPVGPYVVMTFNRIIDSSGNMIVPPELLRKGRIDELWFVPFPTLLQREEIAAIHLRKAKRDPAKFNLRHLARASDNFSGAEIESTIGEAIFYAFADDRELTTEDIEKVMSRTSPVFVSMKEEVGRLIEWVNNRNVRKVSQGDKTVPVRRNGTRTLEVS